MTRIGKFCFGACISKRRSSNEIEHRYEANRNGEEDFKNQESKKDRKHYSKYQKEDETVMLLPQHDSTIEKDETSLCNISSQTDPWSATVREIKDPLLNRKASNIYKSSVDFSSQTIEQPLTVTNFKGKRKNSNSTIEKYTKSLCDASLQTDPWAPLVQDVSGNSLLGEIKNQSLEQKPRNVVISGIEFFPRAAEQQRVTLNSKDKWKTVFTKAVNNIINEKLNSQDLSQLESILLTPTIRNYLGLILYIKRSSDEKISKILEKNTLPLIFTALCSMPPHKSFSDAVLELLLVRCVKHIINLKIGMACLIENDRDLINGMTIGKFTLCLLFLIHHLLLSV